MNSSFIMMMLITTQIIAESFPISSSGHMYMIDRCAQVFGLEYLPHIPEFFEHFLHGPTIIILLIYFYRAWYPLLRFLLMSWSRFLKTGRMTFSQQVLQKLFCTIVGMVVIADGITALVYFLAKKRLYAVTDGMVLVGFVVTMVLLLSLRCVRDWSIYGEYLSRVNIKIPFALGIAQSIALVLPGCSRFASTYVVARWCGVPHRRAFQLSFLMLFPLIVAGFLVNGVRGMIVHGLLFEMVTFPMLAIFASSTVVAYYALKLADVIGKRDRLWWFGVYMLVPVTVISIIIFVIR